MESGAEDYCYGQSEAHQESIPGMLHAEFLDSFVKLGGNVHGVHYHAMPQNNTDVLFDHNISISDISQRGLPNCHLLSELGAGVELHKAEMASIFSPPYLTPSGCHSLRLTIDDRMCFVLLDTVLLAGLGCINGANRREIWPTLLEKGLAKMCNGYYGLGGHAASPLLSNDFFNCHPGGQITSSIFAHTEKPGWKWGQQESDPVVIMAKLQEEAPSPIFENEDMNWAMVCGSKNEVNVPDQDHQGLFFLFGHHVLHLDDRLMPP